MVDAAYRFGIEEEFFLADAATRGTPAGDAANSFHAAVKERLSDAGREVLQSQVEICTEPGTDFDVARDRLTSLRSSLSAIGRENGLLVFAAGTHPLACWPEQNTSAGERYDRMVEQYGILATRNMVSALHVHVEVPEPEHRAGLMRRMVPYLPILHALSCSSPFWEKRRTGLAGYRMAAYREWPRSGLPDLMQDEADYAHYLEVMTRSGAIPDASYLWWAIRPSMHFPTLELRVCDSCTNVEDGVAIAALYRCLVRMLDRRGDVHAGLTGASRAIASENFWRAQRDGVQASFIDETSCMMVPLGDQLGELLALVQEDAAAFGCEALLRRLPALTASGTSADRQVALHEAALSRGVAGDAALAEVVDWLAAATSP